MSNHFEDLFVILFFIIFPLFLFQMIWIYKLKRKITTADKLLLDINYALDGSSIVAITDQNHRILNSGEHGKEFFREMWRTITLGSVWKGEFKNKAKDGAIYWEDTVIASFLNDKGRPYRYVSIRKDISKRKQLEEKIRNNEQKLHSLLQNIHDVIIIFSEDRRILYCSPNIEKFGYEPEHLIGNHTLNFIHPEDEDYATSHFSKILHHPDQNMKYQLRIMKADKSWCHCEFITKNLLKDPQINGILACFHDITEQIIAEEIMQKSEIFSNMGELAAGIAHEIRNPLTSLKGFIHLLKGTYKKEYLDIMASEMDRINSIVGELLLLSKPQSKNFQTLDIRTIITQVVMMMSAEANMRTIEIVNRECQESVFVRCEETKLKQVFINIVKNAMEAMPNGNKLNIISEPYESDKMRIRIIDHGCGIPKEKLKKIGQPFYTTKEKGTGLGLMICFKIIDDHQGQMIFESEVNKGTTVNIILPLTDQLY